MTDAKLDAPIDAQEAFSGTREVDPRYRLNETALDRWMAENVEGYAGPLTISQFKGGQSNPTYALTTPGASYVLRRKPPGLLLPSAHAVDRNSRSSRPSTPRVFRSPGLMLCVRTKTLSALSFM